MKYISLAALLVSLFTIGSTHPLTTVLTGEPLSSMLYFMMSKQGRFGCILLFTNVADEVV